jgi:regulator of protease activity HflC (stomatin/prohibitin superfamily)
MSAFGSFISSEAGGNAIGSLLGLGTGLILSNQQKQLAKGQANDAKAIADAQIKAQELAYQTAQLQLQAQQGAGSGAKSNTGLYIGLGVGGAVILGLVVFLAVKK